MGKGRGGRVEEEEYKNISKIRVEGTASSSFLAIFARLQEQSFDSTFELDSQGTILSKPFPAPNGR